MLNLTRAQTLAGNSSIRTQARAERGCRVTTARAAHHGTFLPHCQSGSGGARQLPGGIGDGSQHRVQAVVPRYDQFLKRRQGRALVKAPGVKVPSKVARRAGGSLPRRNAIKRIEYFS